MSTKHAQERQDERAVSSVVVDRIRDRLTELLEPRSTSETQWLPAHVEGACPRPVIPLLAEVAKFTPAHPSDPTCALCRWALLPGEGQRLVARAQTIEHPPLIEQLHDSIVGSTAGVNASAGGFESRPTLNIEALDALVQIERESRFWVEAITNEPAAMSVVQLVDTLAEKVTLFDRDDLRSIDQDVLKMWGRARIVTTWDSEPLKPHAPCMNCDVRGKLRVDVVANVAACLHCGAAWDQTTIGILGEHIRIALDAEPLRRPPGPGVWPQPDDGSHVGHGKTPWHCSCHGDEHFPARSAAECEDRTAAARAVLAEQR